MALKKEITAASNDLLETLLKRSGINKKDIYQDAIKRFIAGNLDLLTQSEIEEYRKRGLIL